MVKVLLQPWECDWFEHVGRARDLYNRNRGDAHYYDPARMEDNIRASIAACAGEMAVAKLLNLYWDGSAWPLEEHEKHALAPDIRPDIEVRRIRRPDNDLVIRRKDVEQERDVFLTYPEGDRFQHVNVIGFIAAAVGWKYGTVPPWDTRGTSRTVPQSYLSPAEDYIYGK
jgi:hypothetical protein